MENRVRSASTRMLATCALGAAVALGAAGCSFLGGSPASSGSAESSAPSSESAAVESFSSSAITDTPSSSPSSESALQGESAPAGDPALAAQLESSMQAVADGSGMDMGATVVDLGTNTRASVEGDLRFPAASMIKLIVAETFLQQVKAGEYDLDDMYALQEADIVGGTGSLAGLGMGAEVSYRTLVQKMISDSDNAAANALIGEVGMAAVNDEADRLGLRGTQLQRLMMDTDAIAAGRENYTSADDVATLLQMVYDGTFVDAESSQLVLGALEAQFDQDGLKAGLPDGVLFAHKTGSLGNARHDGGIVEADRPYVIVALCGGEGFNVEGAHSAMAQLAATVNAILGP